MTTQTRNEVKTLKAHIAINVKNVEQSIEFYRVHKDNLMYNDVDDAAESNCPTSACCPTLIKTSNPG